MGKVTTENLRKGLDFVASSHPQTCLLLGSGMLRLMLHFSIVTLCKVKHTAVNLNLPLLVPRMLEESPSHPRLWIPLSCGPHPEPLGLHSSCSPLPGWWLNMCRHLHLSGLPSRSGREGSGTEGKSQSPGPGHSRREGRMWEWPPQAGASMQMSSPLYDIISVFALWWLSFHGLDQVKGSLCFPGIASKYLFKAHS